MAVHNVWKRARGEGYQTHKLYCCECMYTTVHVHHSHVHTICSHTHPADHSSIGIGQWSVIISNLLLHHPEMNGIQCWTDNLNKSHNQSNYIEQFTHTHTRVRARTHTHAHTHTHRGKWLIFCCTYSAHTVYIQCTYSKLVTLIWPEPGTAHVHMYVHVYACRYICTTVDSGC